MGGDGCPGCLSPQVKFLTKIWHPNVDYEKGEPCVDFLTESWKPEMTLRHVLQTVRGLMALPNAGESCVPIGVYRVW